MRPDRHWERRAFSLAVITGVVVVGGLLAVAAVVWEGVKLVWSAIG